MKERPILFTGAMVRALLAGDKTQTRRIVKSQPPEGEHVFTGLYHPTVVDRHGEEQPGTEVFGAYTQDGEWALPCSYGQPGDRLWVRETFYAYGRWETRYSAKKKRDEWHFVDMTIECDRRYQYAADNPDVPLAKGRGGSLTGWYTRPAIFMPRAACRVLLDIALVRIERLQDISRGDAMDEGCPFPNMAQGDNPRKWYADLWESINDAGSWAANPWVWVVEFRRISNEVQ